jgi:AmiR/NasT family two-component response regulator
VIALLGTETPSRLKLVLDLDPASFLIKPLRSAGIYAALVMGFERSERTDSLKQQVLKLEERLRSRRVVPAANQAAPTREPRRVYTGLLQPFLTSGQALSLSGRNA